LSPSLTAVKQTPFFMKIYFLVKLGNNVSELVDDGLSDNHLEITGFATSISFYLQTVFSSDS